MKALLNFDEYVPSADIQHMLILTYVALNDKTTMTEIASHFDWSEPTTSRKIRVLVDAGLLQSDEGIYPSKLLRLSYIGTEIMTPLLGD